MDATDPLLASFPLLPGVGHITERRLWREGVANFHDFLATSRIHGISPARKRDLDAQAVRALDAHGAADFARRGARVT